MLVGGGELHDRWETLVGVRAPLSRGIQRFTGITQAMVDAAPPRRGDAARARRPPGRAACSSRTTPSLRPPRAAPGVRARRRRLARPAGAVHRRAGAPPRTRWRASGGSRALAESLGDRGRGHPPRARRRRDVRARACARCSRACARTRGRSATRSRCCARARPGARARGATDGGRAHARRAPAPARPWTACPTSPASTSSATPRARCSTSASRSRVRTRARAHFQPSATEGSWVAQAETVDYETTRSELGALLLEGRLIRRHRPPGNVRLKHVDGYVYLRCRLDIAFPVLEVAPAPAPGLGGERRPAARPRARGRAARAAQLAASACATAGARSRGASSPSAYGQMGRCLSPCLGDLDPNLYRRRLDQALALFTGEGDGGAALLAHVDDADARAPPRAEQFERAGWLRRRRERLAWLLERPRRRGRRHARAAAARAGRAPARRRASTPCGSSAGASSTGARSTRPRTSTTSARRTAEALRARRAPRRHGVAGARRRRRGAARRDVAGARRGAGVATLGLRPAPSPARLAGFLAGAAEAAAAPRAASRPGGSKRQRDDLGGRAAVAGGELVARLGLAAHDAPGRSAPSAAETTLLVEPADLALAEAQRRCRAAPAALSRRPRRWRLGLPRQCRRATVSWPT